MPTPRHADTHTLTPRFARGASQLFEPTEQRSIFVERLKVSSADPSHLPAGGATPPHGADDNEVGKGTALCVDKLEASIRQLLTGELRKRAMHEGTLGFMGRGDNRTPS